jgi:hypothetical protein
MAFRIPGPRRKAQGDVSAQDGGFLPIGDRDPRKRKRRWSAEDTAQVEASRGWPHDTRKWMLYDAAIVAIDMQTKVGSVQAERLLAAALVYDTVRGQYCERGEPVPAFTIRTRGYVNAAHVRKLIDDALAACPGNGPGQAPARTIAKKKRRGPVPVKTTAAKDAMLVALSTGTLSVDDLESMKEEALAATYSVSRQTVRQARAAALSEFCRS